MSKLVWDEKSDIDSLKKSFYENRAIVNAHVSAEATQAERDAIAESEHKLVAALAKAVRGRETLQTSIASLRRAVATILDENQESPTPSDGSLQPMQIRPGKWMKETEKLFASWHSGRTTNDLSMAEAKKRLRLKMALARSAKMDVESPYSTLTDLCTALAVDRDCLRPSTPAEEILADCLQTRARVVAQHLPSPEGHLLDAPAVATLICLQYSTEQLLASLATCSTSLIPPGMTREEFERTVKSEQVQGVIQELKRQHAGLMEAARVNPKQVHPSRHTISWIVALLSIWLPPLYSGDKDDSGMMQDSPVVVVDVFRALRSAASRKGVVDIIKATDAAQISPSQLQAVAETSSTLALLPCGAQVIATLQSIELEFFKKETRQSLRRLQHQHASAPYLDQLQSLLTTAMNRDERESYQASPQARATTFFQLLGEIDCASEPEPQNAVKYMLAMAFIAARTPLLSDEFKKIFSAQTFAQAELDAVRAINLTALTDSLIRKAFGALKQITISPSPKSTTSALRAIIFTWMPAALSRRPDRGPLHEVPEWIDLVRLVIADWSLILSEGEHIDESFTASCVTLAGYLLSVSQELGSPSLAHLREETERRLLSKQEQLGLGIEETFALPNLGSVCSLLHPILHKDAEITQRLREVEKEALSSTEPISIPKFPLSNAVRLLDLVEAPAEKAAIADRSNQSSGFSISGLLGARASSSFLPTLGAGNGVPPSASLSSFTARLAGAWR